MREYFIGNEKYTQEIFNCVYSLLDVPNWNKIDNFMDREYMLDWIKYKESRDVRTKMVQSA
jgi:hypothetical protein